MAHCGGLSHPQEHAGLNADAFIHLPELRTRVTHPEKSRLRLTPEMFAMWEQRVREAGWPADWRRPGEGMEAARPAGVGGSRAGRGPWVFCSGSPVWGPRCFFGRDPASPVPGDTAARS